MSERIADAIRFAQQQFELISDSAKLDAELLLAACLQKPRSYLYSWPEKTLSTDIWLAFQNLIEQRLQSTPVAYLLGYREFYSLQFATSPVALIPRAETELLVETALQLCAGKRQPRILEMGTGTGAIAIALLHNRVNFELVATDISTDCLALARKNAAAHGITLNTIESNWYEQLAGQKPFDLIVCNPPYIAADDPCLQQGDLPAEPLLALTPGQSGLEAIAQIVTGAGDFLQPYGYLLFEHGYDQARAAAGLLQSAGFKAIRTIVDHNGQARIALGQWR